MSNKQVYIFKLCERYNFVICLMRDVLLLLSTILYNLWVNYHEYLKREWQKDLKKHRQQ